MEVFIVRSWKVLALRGLAGVLFGVIALLWPSITLVALVLLFGGYAMVDGLLALAAATRACRLANTPGCSRSRDCSVSVPGWRPFSGPG
jgi:uncharacterized membrane protein HdeD (DUF308 family)